MCVANYYKNVNGNCIGCPKNYYSNIGQDCIKCPDDAKFSGTAGGTGQGCFCKKGYTWNSPTRTCIKAA